MPRVTDYPVKCRKCRRWMRSFPYVGWGLRKYVERRKAPNADRCVKCPIAKEKP